MHSTISEQLPAHAVGSRRERAGLSRQEACRQSFGRFCEEIERCKALFGTQRRVAKLIGKLTLKRGVTSIDFPSLDLLTRVDARRASFAGLGANDLSLAVNGGLRRRPGKEPVLVAGLKQLGIVVVDERSALEAALPRTVWTLVSDSRQWLIPSDGWFNTASEEAEWLMHVEALCRWPTPALPGLAAEADLHDGRASVMPMAHAATPAMSDAREVPPMAERRAVAPCRSESRNAGNQGIGRCVPTFGTRSNTTRARLSNLDSGQWTDKTGQSSAPARGMGLDSSRREELKGKLHGDEREFYYVASTVLGVDGWNDRGPAGKWSPNGVRWMKRWQAGGEHRRKAVGVFAEMLGVDFVVLKTPATAANELWNQMGGQALDAARLSAAKNSRNLFNHQ